ncbi:uncharacterized protein EI97DRAFT_180682 [Westerdykella ornata]|uniref:Uncharacterized protein n=1 Tax=Westerdykella ornata TaxID=318751 RepID=A0A6A6JV06_WESOR|nr:uncharacterized protein EI97DRAFT_180682 [Westerdykella ornata]KAF2279576.1 hypothetical protein EI97DRAFT_180682 [Westerdykella ornata]
MTRQTITQDDLVSMFGPLSAPFRERKSGIPEDLQYGGFRVNARYVHNNEPLTQPSGHVPVSLFSLITRFRDVGASDPRDKVFAFLHMATETLDLKANYRASPQFIYLRTAQLLLKKDLTLLSHVQDPEDTKLTGLPSLVPDFSVPLGRVPFATSEPCVYSASGSGGAQPLFFRTADQETGKLEVLVLCGRYVDTVAGVARRKGCYFTRVGELALQTPKFYSKVTGLEYTRKSRKYLHYAFGTEEYEGGPAPLCRVEALWRTLIGDYSSGLYPAPVTTGFGFSEWVATHLHHSTHLSALAQDHIAAANPQAVSAVINDFDAIQKRKQDVFTRLHPDEPGGYLCFDCANEFFNDRFADDGDAKRMLDKVGLVPAMHPVRYMPDADRLRALQPCFPNLLSMTAKEDRLEFARDSSKKCPDLSRAEAARRSEFENRMREVKKGRRMFRTERDLLGMGTKSVREGDEVWILPGAKVPFVLRPVKGKTPKRFRLVEEAYLHGYMDGEVLGEGRELEAFGLV